MNWSPRFVLKVGTSSVVDPTTHRVDAERVQRLVRAVLQASDSGWSPVLVVSGAIAVGSSRLASGPAASVFMRQLSAAVGQCELFGAVARGFAERGRLSAQFLLSPLDLLTPEHADGVRGALHASWGSSVIPVVNENDAVCVRNNDILAALLACVVGAERLALLTDVDGLWVGRGREPDSRQLVHEALMSPVLEAAALGQGSGLGSGGMEAKLRAAWIATLGGVPTTIANSGKEGVLQGLLSGAEGLGTRLLPVPSSASGAPDLELLYSVFRRSPAGVLHCDASLDFGDANVRRHHVVGVEGTFDAGDVVRVCQNNQEVVRGIVCAGSAALHVPVRCDGDMTVTRSLTDQGLVPVMLSTDYVVTNGMNR